MSAALAVELLKLRRSTVVKGVTAALVLLVPLVATGFTVAAARDGDSVLAERVRPMLLGEGWTALLGSTGQMLTVAVLLGVGFVVSWTFAREFTDRTVEPLAMSRSAPHQLVSAKMVAVVAWGCAACVAAVLVAVVVGSAVGTTVGSPWPTAGRALVGALLTVLLALPAGAVASAGRSELAGVGAVLGLVVVTQIVTVTGAGAWFPYAAPALWLGMGGSDVTASALQLLLAVPVGAAGWTATAWWWHRAELVSH